MKKILIIGLILMSVLSAQAQFTALPEVSLDVSALGGHIILINMKDSLIISGEETAEIETEIGPYEKDNLFKDLLMNIAAEDIEKKYIDNGASRVMVQKIINRYTYILHKQSQKNKLD